MNASGRQELQSAVPAERDTRRELERRADFCLHDLFACRAREHPERVAVAFGPDMLSYGELDRRSNQLAHRLASLGVGPDVLVGVRIERSIAMIVAVLAVLKAGGAYVPFDPEHPPERLRFMLADTGVAVMLTQASLSSDLRGWSGSVLELDTHDPATAAAPTSAPVIRVSPRNLAYVIYTSGSTGKPKGVLVEHRGLTNLSGCLEGAFSIAPEDTILQFARLTFDASVWEMAMALAAGAKLQLIDAETIHDGLGRMMENSGVTIATLPPSILSALEGFALSGLRTMVVAGEACPPPLATRWSSGRRLVNAYGPTETTVCATFAEIVDPAVISIGRAIVNAEVHVLDAGMRLAPPGVAGELFIGGAGVARGYLNRPGLTAERFVPHPFAHGERLYRSGDLARLRPDGEIEFLGRIDHQIKIRGFRIEPGEIEALLRARGDIRDAVVIARTEPAGDTRLVAYCVIPPDAAFDPDALRQDLLASLPDYMVPAAMMRIDALPLTPNGKLDRNALPAPEQSRRRTNPHTPTSPLETLILDIWKQVLNLQTIGTNDNFFDLGGNSLAGMRIVQQLQTTLVIRLALRDVFDHPTVGALAMLIEPMLDEE